MATVQNGKLFSCGNHSTESIKGMLHFGDPSTTVCILAVPSTMTVRDVIQFLNPSMQDIENTRIIREVNYDSTYIVLLTFRKAEAAQQFYLNYDGIPYNSIEDNVCKLLYVTRIETFAEDPAKIDDSSNCTICFDKMYPDVESIITILCNHSFHVHCLSRWSDTSCPVCRYCQTPECQVESKCMTCSYEGESLWICVICGHVACGRYINGHAFDHFTETQHTYAMHLSDNQVWDYAGDNYVHRLLANKADGKPVEVEGTDAQRQAGEKIEAVQLEYTYLLTQQLESQRKYYEKLMRDNEKQCQKKINSANAQQKKAAEELQALQDKHNQTLKDKNALEKKLNSSQSRLAKLQASLSEERSINKSLTLNQEQWQQKLAKLEKELEDKKKIIVELEEQQKDLMLSLDGREMVNKLVELGQHSLEDIEGGQIVIGQPSTSKAAKNHRRKKK